ncbi:MAG: TetR/AcrR family transcriptional regulator [Saprospiraceae bacterium]|nr:TetR/AcrR family transcriptional regulator [Saprospiraceae bacterium]MCB9319040.1 TetR/AcrR family transcriptional regulator [Lewinellaceae bacterium]
MVKTSRRSNKEHNILDAAERVFHRHGFTNAKMEWVGEEAGMSKASVYFYFESKENLYMAIVYRALSLLNDLMYAAIQQNKSENGLNSVVALMNTYFDFSQKYPLYTEAMLDYTAVIRSTSAGNNEDKLSDALKGSVYFMRLKDIHNIPVSIVVQEIKRGMEDGSIHDNRKPEMLYLSAWAMVLGYLKLTNLAGRKHSLHTVQLDEWKEYLIALIKHTLIHPV